MALLYLTRPLLRRGEAREVEEEDEDDEAWPGVEGRSSERVSDEEDEPASIAMDVSEKADWLLLSGGQVPRRFPLLRSRCRTRHCGGGEKVIVEAVE